MDVAKSISLLATQKGDLEEFIRGRTSLKKRQITSLMIPTTAAHSVSYPLTSYFNIPHGHAVALYCHILLNLIMIFL